MKLPMLRLHLVSWDAVGWLSAATLLLFGICQGWSQGTVYTDRPSFIAACQRLSGLQSAITFDRYLGGEYHGGLTVSNVTFSGNILVRWDPPFSIYGEPAVNNYDMDTPMGVHFERGALAFGADFSSLLWPYNGSNFTATLSIQGGSTYSFSAAPGPGATFFGFIETTPFRDLTFSDGGAFGIRQGTAGLPGGTYHEELIGNPYVVQFVPEPSLAVQIFLGVAFFCFQRRGPAAAGMPQTPTISAEGTAGRASRCRSAGQNWACRRSPPRWTQ